MASLVSSDQERISAMRVGGRALGTIRQQLVEFTQVGTTFEEIEAEAQRLIKAGGFKPSFSTVRDYQWATCIMKNEQLCHGIPRGYVVEAGDVITIDVGLINQGYHLDTTTTFAVGEVDGATKQFLEVGRSALKKAIQQVKHGQSVYQISKAMQKTVEKAGYSPVYQLTGHGVGKELHLDPNIPCVAEPRDKRVLISSGDTLAIEIMYAMGDSYLVEAPDGWTYQTADGSLSGMFEETVLVTQTGVEILTNPAKNAL